MSKIEKFKVLGEENAAFFDDETMIANLFNLLEYINDSFLHLVIDAFCYLGKVIHYYFYEIINNKFYMIKKLCFIFTLKKMVVC